MEPKPQFLYQIPRIRDGIDHLLSTDPVFKKTGLTVDSFPHTYYGPGFQGLVRIVVGQQISAQAANALWQRFEEDLADISPNTMLVLKDDEMRKLGLSHQKAKYIRELSAAIKEGRFNPDKVNDLSDDDVYEHITALKGFGDWSAEMYLIFCLARTDIWPAGDLGIQTGLKFYLGLDERPDFARTKKEGERFKPYRTAAAILLWRYKALKEAEARK